MRDLFDAIDPPQVGGPGDTPFGGSTVGAVDTPRLTAQLERVRAVMAGGDWWTPEQLEAATGDRWASISARIRDLRKPQIAGRQVERKNLGRGNFIYRLVPLEKHHGDRANAGQGRSD